MENNRRPLGIICAMDVEIRDLMENLSDEQVLAKAGYEFHVGRLSGVPVVLVQCGVGKVNAARGTQMLIDLFDPEGIINSGVAGGTADGLSIGDIVVGRDFIQHDFDVTALGYAKGYMCTGADSSRPTVYTADAALSKELTEAASGIADGRGVREGRIVSGDMFINTVGKKAELAEMFGATCAEMEGAAIAQTCAYSGVPFGVLRVISDLANGTSPENYAEFEKISAAFSAEVILRFVAIHGGQR